eukprot:TRINITY_DN10624_c0_g1_i1.p2 TRINITY_DN10624_c0_g1~~TRINITY_DN10624_c0_g1_i1.p2  ORF type:complete len:155 (-),score=22.52 TRINITY_DN10624_c0_g1_i1:808-1272(-)
MLNKLSTSSFPLLYFFLFDSLFQCVFIFFFFFNDKTTTEIYTILFVGSVRCVQETGFTSNYQNKEQNQEQIPQYNSQNDQKFLRQFSQLYEKYIEDDETKEFEFESDLEIHPEQIQKAQSIAKIVHMAWIGEDLSLEQFQLFSKLVKEEIGRKL